MNLMLVKPPSVAKGWHSVVVNNLSLPPKVVVVVGRGVFTTLRLGVLFAGFCLDQQQIQDCAERLCNI